MSNPTGNETWIIETGDNVVRKMRELGSNGLTQWDNLVYCLWVADYGMRNAGDLDTAADLYASFHSEGRHIAKALSLPITLAAFSLNKAELELEYFDRFESMVEEIKKAKSRSAQNV